MALLSFLGATQEVTSSCYLIETRDGSRVLLECGMHQGRREEEKGNARPFPFDPGSLNAVVISHAHIDYSGLLPRLFACGYKGQIFATEATCEPLELMLLDSAHLQENNAEWENEWQARLGKPPVQPLYTMADAGKALSLYRPQLYGSALEVAPGMIITFHEARHILGSTIVEMELHDHHLTRHQVFSGDLGNTCTPLMRDPTPFSRADVVLLESTYGDRDHRDNEATLSEFAETLQNRRQRHVHRRAHRPPLQAQPLARGVLSGVSRLPGQGTLGRLIVNGANSVKVLHQHIAVRAQMHTLGGFSTHAGQSQLIDWVRHFDHRPELYLVHGELEKMQVLHQRLNRTANILEFGEQIVI